MTKFSVKLLISILTLFGALLLSNTSAAEELIYGPEWTFTNQELLEAHEYSTALRNEIFEKVFKKIDAHYAKLCRSMGCEYNKLKNTMTLDSGITIQFTEDGGVVEIKTTPMSLEMWKKHQDFFQEHVFNVLAKMGLTPHEREGAGHLNIGLKYFETKPLLFRNFIVDFYNHPGLGTVLNSLQANMHDARYIADMMVNGESPIEITPEKLKNIHKNLAKLDASPQLQSVQNYKDSALSFTDRKTVALRVHNSYDKPTYTWRAEIRTLRPQQNMGDFISAIEIFEANIKYIEKNFKEPIVLLQPQKVTDGWKALGEFADYIDRTGLKWQNYRHLMPAMWRDLDEKNFIRGNNRPQMMQPPNACQMILL